MWLRKNFKYKRLLTAVFPFRPGDLNHKKMNSSDRKFRLKVLLFCPFYSRNGGTMNKMKSRQTFFDVSYVLTLVLEG